MNNETNDNYNIRVLSRLQDKTLRFKEKLEKVTHIPLEVRVAPFVKKKQL